MTEEKPLEESQTEEQEAPRPVFKPEIRPAAEPVCCGSGCAGCPNFA